MVKAMKMLLMLVGLLLHTIALADDASSPDLFHETTRHITDTVRTSLPLEIADTQISFSALETLEFHDSSTVGRARKIRSLSLLTLAEFKRSRLYLGVNQRGFLGLHFNAAQKNDRCLEVARMPYLQKHHAE